MKMHAAFQSELTRTINWMPRNRLFDACRYVCALLLRGRRDALVTLLCCWLRCDVAVCLDLCFAVVLAPNLGVVGGGGERAAFVVEVVRVRMDVSQRLHMPMPMPCDEKRWLR